MIQLCSWIAVILFMPEATVSRAVTVAALAMVLSLLGSEPVWRAPLQAVFALAIFLGSQEGGLPPEAWFGLFVVTLLIFGGGTLSAIRAPLYLTNARALDALQQAIPPETQGRCLDVGAGLGSFIRVIAPYRPKLQFEGVERAPLTCFIGSLWCRQSKTGRIFWGDLWRTDLAPYQVLYVFLSPEAMPDVWQKAQREMARGSLVIVHAFAIPEAPVEASFRYGPSASEVIYRYRI